jgi:hypothetical protein
MLGVKRLWQAPSTSARQTSETILNNDMLILGCVSNSGCVARMQADWTANPGFGSPLGGLDLNYAMAV